MWFSALPSYLVLLGPYIFLALLRNGQIRACVDGYFGDIIIIIIIIITTTIYTIVPYTYSHHLISNLVFVLIM
jgi:hypothetical protein